VGTQVSQLPKGSFDFEYPKPNQNQVLVTKSRLSSVPRIGLKINPSVPRIQK